MALVRGEPSGDAIVPTQARKVDIPHFHIVILYSITHVFHVSSGSDIDGDGDGDGDDGGDISDRRK